MKRIIASTLFGLALSTGVYAEDNKHLNLEKKVVILQNQMTMLIELHAKRALKLVAAENEIRLLKLDLEGLEDKTIDALRIGDATHKGLLKNTTLNRMRIEVLERTRGPKSNPRMIGPNRFNQEM